MLLKVIRSAETRRVSPEDVENFTDFSRRYRTSESASQLQMFERFFAARSLVSHGADTLLDPSLSDYQDRSVLRVDVCGIQGAKITAFFCEEEGSLRPTLATSIEKIQSSKNTKAVILVPSRSDMRTARKTLLGIGDTEKVAVETLDWFDSEMDAVVQKTLRLISTLGNETRFRMLTPLFSKTGAKRDYRAKINPKLVYENLSILTGAGLIREMTKGGYELSELGKSILAEFITFLERTRKTLEAQKLEKQGGESD